MSNIHSFLVIRRVAIAALLLVATSCAEMKTASNVAANTNVAVAPQYDTTHVYVDAPAHYDALVSAWNATFGGKPSQRITANIMPVEANTQFQYVWSPVGNLSTFSFLTSIPYPFGQERTGWLVTDMDRALAAARAAGAEVIVEKYKDPIGYDAVIQFPGGVKFQLYWHFDAPNYAPLESVPDNRVYVSPEAADIFVKDFLAFSHGRLITDDKKADAAEIGKNGETMRRIRIESNFGKMLVFVTDGHLPYPFGHEITGYEVKDLGETLARATKAGAKVLSPRNEAREFSTAMVEFPGGYIAEIHAPRAH
ncbi:glyoxalase [Dokdonella soli]|uniref:Glyoxalase/bleomycin resistance/dioxygenase family protein n=1 Tax=Dokdonella soli TaxID=529810 RepID=A0ABN1ICU1_9GAMM